MREKIRNNINSSDRRFGVLNHDINEYFDCIPLINTDQFKTLLNKDKTVWKTYSDKASEKA